MWKSLSELFWTESLWLSPGTTWEDVANGPEKNVLYPDVKDFLYQIPMIVILLTVRYALEKNIYVKLGRALGVEDKKPRNIPNIPLLQSAYRKSPKNIDVTALAKQLDISERKVERWWRRRRIADQPSKLTKFCEHVWKATYYGSNCIFGLYIMWDKDYFWNPDKCFIGYPNQGVTNDLWWFYVINTAYTWVSVITVFYEVRRKDFAAMVLHHILAGLMLLFSWMGSLFRIGAVMLPLQDGSEALFEVAKALKKAKFRILHILVMAVSVFFWFYVRIYVFIFHILYSTIIAAQNAVSMYFVVNLLITMLLILLFLQIYWSILILRGSYNYVVSGIPHDPRSSLSEKSDSDEKHLGRG